MLTSSTRSLLAGPSKIEASLMVSSSRRNPRVGIPEELGWPTIEEPPSASRIILAVLHLWCPSPNHALCRLFSCFRGNRRTRSRGRPRKRWPTPSGPYRPVLAKQPGWSLPGPRALGVYCSHFSPLLARPFGSPSLPAFADPGWSIQPRQGAFCSARCQRRLRDAKQRLTSGKYVLNKTAPCPDALSRRRGNPSLMSRRNSYSRVG